MKRILIIGTLDTKGEEFAFLRDEIRRMGCATIVMDLGILGASAFDGDITREMVLDKAGVSLADLQDGNARGLAIDAAILGGQRFACEMYERNEFDGAIAMGGGSGTSMGCAILRELPIGVPKCQVTTLSNMTQFLGHSDICVIRSMVDLVGLNSLTRTVIQEAAAAIVGMANNPPSMGGASRCLAITCLGVTTPAVTALREKLIKAGKEVVVLHFYTQIADELAKSGQLEAMLDITPCELTKGLVYPSTDGMPYRLSEARKAGIPIIVAPGALDMLLNATPVEKLPRELSSRQFIVHSPNMTLLKTSSLERRRIGEYIGEQLRESQGPKAVLIPGRGFSMWDKEGKAFFDPCGIDAFETGVRCTADAQTDIVRADMHINDEAFANLVVETLDRLSSYTKEDSL